MGVFRRQADIEAALEDAETSVRADPDYEKGHLALVVAYESAGVSLARQLEVVERGLEACPHSEVLVTRKWRLKKAIAERGQTPDAAPEQEIKVDPSVWSIESTKRLANDPKDPRRPMA